MGVRSPHAVTLLIRKRSPSSRLGDVLLVTGSEEEAAWRDERRDEGFPFPYRDFFHLHHKVLATTNDLAIELPHLTSSCLLQLLINVTAEGL